MRGRGLGARAGLLTEMVSDGLIGQCERYPGGGDEVPDRRVGRGPSVVVGIFAGVVGGGLTPELLVDRTGRLLEWSGVVILVEQG